MGHMDASNQGVEKHPSAFIVMAQEPESERDRSNDDSRGIQNETGGYPVDSPGHYRLWFGKPSRFSKKRGPKPTAHF
jgi:hypothetical protein